MPIKHKATLASYALLLVPAVEGGEASAQEHVISATPRTPGIIDPPAGPDSGDAAYPASFYIRFQPQTALEMLERTPGFVLDEGESVRGFGGAAGNVLVDGQRPTIKSGGISAFLERIPAARVEAIHLLGKADRSQAQGQSLIANVILKSDVGMTGLARATLTHTADGRISPTGSISLSRDIGNWKANIELSAGQDRYPEKRAYTFHDAQRAPSAWFDEKLRSKAPQASMAATASRPWAGGTLNLNTRVGYDGYFSVTERYANQAEDPPVRSIDYFEKAYLGEFGADWVRPLGKGWNAKLVGLGRVEKFRANEDFRETAYRGLASLEQRPLELVGRVTINREGERAFLPEIGAEVVWNRLSSNLDYAEDSGAGLTPVTLSGANTVVSELRSEAFANTTLKISRSITLEMGTAVEFSRISVSSDHSNSQSLVYLKPSAAILWSAGPHTQFRLGMRRDVDQLDFSDFAASVDQQNERPLGGNPELRPARLTRLLARVDHRWGNGGALSLEAFHQRHKGLLGYLLLPSGDQALGSIGDGRQSGVTGQATLPLSALLSGAQFTLEGTLRKSRLKDPLTGRRHSLNDLRNREISGEFRHDVPKLRSSWGIRYSGAVDYRARFIDEDVRVHGDPEWTVYVENSSIRGLKSTVTLEAITGNDSYRLRKFYRPTRAAQFAGDELREARLGARISFSVTKTL